MAGMSNKQYEEIVARLTGSGRKTDHSGGFDPLEEGALVGARLQLLSFRLRGDAEARVLALADKCRTQRLTAAQGSEAKGLIKFLGAEPKADELDRALARIDAIMGGSV